MELQEARRQLARIETARTNPHSRHVLWEAGTAWLEAFKQLIDATAQADARAIQRIDSAPSPEERRSRSDDRVYAALDEERWNNAVFERLTRTRAQLRAEPQPNRHLLNELSQHQIAFERYWRDRQVVRCQVALEHMEHRRALGRLTDADWQAGWGKLLAAQRAQAKVYEQSSAGPLPSSFYTARLEWYRRLRAIQRELQRDRRGSRVDQALLRAHAGVIDQQIGQLDPRRPFVTYVLAMAVIAIVALPLLMMRTGLAGPGEVTVTPTATPVVGLAPPGIAAPANPDALNEHGKALLRQGRYTEALDLFQQASAAKPGWHEPHTNSGFCLYELGKPQKAIAEWRTAIELSGEGQDAHAGLGMALFQTGDREGGLREYQLAIELGGSYMDEEWMRTQRDWSARAIADSRPLREALR